MSRKSRRQRGTPRYFQASQVLKDLERRELEAYESAIQDIPTSARNLVGRSQAAGAPPGYLNLGVVGISGVVYKRRLIEIIESHEPDNIPDQSASNGTHIEVYAKFRPSNDPLDIGLIRQITLGVSVARAGIREIAGPEDQLALEFLGLGDDNVMDTIQPGFRYIVI